LKPTTLKGRLVQLQTGAMLSMAFALSPDALAATSLVNDAPIAEKPASLRFEKVFSPHGEPKAVHYKVDLWHTDQVHHLEVWRNGGDLTRRTDDVIEIHAQREASGPEFRLAIMDLKKKIITTIHRTNLARIGDFTEWYDLAHGLKFPKGNYTLQAVATPKINVKPYATCRWYQLSQPHAHTLVCWNESARIPLQLVNEQGQLLWNVTSIEHRITDSEIFKIKDDGYIRNDANQDIDRD
jgi:hypothetical protein